MSKFMFEIYEFRRIAIAFLNNLGWLADVRGVEHSTAVQPTTATSADQLKARITNAAQ
jgi:hypothetical protein